MKKKIAVVSLLALGIIASISGSAFAASTTGVTERTTTPIIKSIPPDPYLPVVRVVPPDPYFPIIIAIPPDPYLPVIGFIPPDPYTPIIIAVPPDPYRN